MQDRQTPALRVIPGELARTGDEVAAVLATARDVTNHPDGGLHAVGVKRAGEWLGRLAPKSPLTNEPGAPPVRHRVLAEIDAGLQIEAGGATRSDEPLDLVRGVVDMLSWAMSTDPDAPAPV